MEPATRRRVDRRRRLTGDRGSGDEHVGIGDRDRLDEHLGVGVRRPAVEVVAGGDFAQLAEIHHGHTVTDVLDDGQVVGDEDQGQPVLGLEIFEQVQHLGLHADVECRDRLVADDQGRIEHQRPGDRDPLTLAAGELMGSALSRPLGIDPDLLQNRVHELDPLIFRATLPDVERVLDAVANFAAGVETGDRVLEDHLDLRARLAQFAVAERREVGSLEADGPGGRGRDLHDRHTRGGFAASRLADDAERFAPQHVEADAGDGADGSVATHRELDHEVVDAQHDVAVAEVGGAGARHQIVPPIRTLVMISASRSWNSGDPTGYQHA